MTHSFFARAFAAIELLWSAINHPRTDEVAAVPDLLYKSVRAIDAAALAHELLRREVGGLWACLRHLDALRGPRADR